MTVTTLDATPAKQPAAKTKEAAPAQILKPTGGSGDFSGKYARIFISVNPDAPGGKDAVFLGVAGVGYQVPRGRQWIVPVELANVLRDAVHTSYEEGANGKTDQRVDSPRFGFTAENLSDEEAEELLTAQREKIAAAA